MRWVCTFSQLWWLVIFHIATVLLTAHGIIHCIIHSFIIRVHHVPQHTRASVPHAALYRSKKINKMT